MKKVIDVSFKTGGKVYHFAPGEFKLEQGEFVIVETIRGPECGEVVQGIHEVPNASVTKELKPIIRKATKEDIKQMNKNREDAAKAFHVTEKKIAEHKLEMQLLDVEYTLDRSKMLFNFSADGRIDFRELVKDLAGTFKTRVELRQIGARDESRMLGGLGICGQALCCSRFLKDFQPVSIKMAKEQGLSLNPQKISGFCGRLMCCLAFEQPAYEYLSRTTPTIGSIVKCPDGVGTVTEVLLASSKLRVKLDGSMVYGKLYDKKDCEYIKGGKRTPEPEDKEPEIEE